MNEILKTMGFVGAAVLVVAIAWLARPGSPVADTTDMQGVRLFPDFKDPLAATSMEILVFDQEATRVRPFTVAQVDVKGEGKLLWALPTHENYPADAKDQVADAAAGVMGLEILDVVGTSPSDHEDYGVVDPDPNKRKGTTGVGTRVTMKNNRDKVLMSLVIGKEVPDRSGLRYVRKVDEDPVYIVKVSTDKLSSKFEDWIEEDLLKLSTWDIKQIQTRDHSVDEFNMQLIQRGEMMLDYDDTGDTKWKLVKDETFQNGKWVPLEMAEDEELDTEKLDAMKNALDDLEIVDVRRKPSGLSGDLKAAADFAANDKALASLAEHGFYVARVNDRVELFSNEGEIRCLMKDGAEYVLRFGEIAGVGSTDSEKKEGEEEAEGSGSPGLNRFIFVMAEFNPDSIPKPELEPLPEEDKKSPEDTTAEDTTAEDTAAEDTAAEDTAAEDTTAEGTAAEGTAAEEEAAGDTAAEDTTAEEEAAEEEVAGGEKPDGEENTDEPSEEESPDAAAEDKKDEADDDAAEEEYDAEAERERITRENQRKQEEYDEKITEGKTKVEELNDRFADWYYVISDKVYQEIHLGRDQIVKKKEKEEGEDPAEEDSAENDEDLGTDSGPLDVFKKLEQLGPGGSE